LRTGCPWAWLTVGLFVVAVAVAAAVVTVAVAGTPILLPVFSRLLSSLISAAGILAGTPC
jgi:hypothetical protein